MTPFHVLSIITGILLNLCNVNGERKSHYKPNAASIVYFSVPTKELADRLSRLLIYERLIACANVLPDITAVFPINENNDIKAEVQSLVIAKSATSRIQDVVECIKKNHPDSMPDIVATPIKSGNGMFLEWVLSVVPPQIKKCLLNNSTNPKPKRTIKKGKTITTLTKDVEKEQNSAEPNNDLLLNNENENNEGDQNEQTENPEDLPPEMEEEKDINYSSGNPNEGNDPNESHANSYP